MTSKPSLKSSGNLGSHQIHQVLVAANIIADVNAFVVCFHQQKYTFHISQQRQVV